MEVALNKVAVLASPKLASTVDPDTARFGSCLAVNVFWAALSR